MIPRLRYLIGKQDEYEYLVPFYDPFDLPRTARRAQASAAAMGFELDKTVWRIGDPE